MGNCVQRDEKIEIELKGLTCVNCCGDKELLWMTR